MRTEVDRAFKSEQFDRKALEDVRFEGCAFDNCSARRSIFRRVEFVKTRVRACSLHDCTLEDSAVDGLRVRLEGGGGRNTPLFCGAFSRSASRCADASAASFGIPRVRISAGRSTLA